MQLNRQVYCKQEIIEERPGWTGGRVEKFLFAEAEHYLRGQYGWYTKYEYSLPQILDAEKSELWQRAAAKYLRVPVEKLGERIEEVELERAQMRVQAVREIAALRAEREAERQALIDSVRGGLTLVGYTDPLHDGWRSFETSEVMPFVELREELAVGKWTPELVSKFYSLWNSGSGYCNPLGSVRKIIAPQKESLMQLILSMAQKSGWNHGEGKDDRGARVLYIDTPAGQVSFHLRFYDDKFSSYAGRWSGLRNSGEIIASLLAAKTPDIDCEAISNAA